MLLNCWRLVAYNKSTKKVKLKKFNYQNNKILYSKYFILFCSFELIDLNVVGQVRKKWQIEIERDRQKYTDRYKDRNRKR